MTPEKELENLIALQKIGEERILLLTEQIENQKIDIFNWENCFQNKGYYINNCSRINGSKIDGTVITTRSKNEIDKRVFRTSKEAKSALAMSQLSHIIWVANGCEEMEWIDTSKYKYVITRVFDKIQLNVLLNSHYFLAFKTEEIRNKVYEENKQLVHDFLMII